MSQTKAQYTTTNFLHRYKVLKMTPSSDYVWILVEHWKLTSFLKVYGVDYNKIIQPCQNVLKETQPDNDGIRSIKCGNNIFIIEDVKEKDVNSKHEYYLKVDNNSFNFQDFDSSWYSAVPVDSTTPVGRHLINCDYFRPVPSHNLNGGELNNNMGKKTRSDRFEQYSEEIKSLKHTLDTGGDNSEAAEKELDIYDKYFGSKSCPGKDFDEYKTNLAKSNAKLQLEEEARPIAERIYDAVQGIVDDKHKMNAGQKEVYRTAYRMAGIEMFGGINKSPKRYKSKKDVSDKVWNFFRHASEGFEYITLEGEPIKLKTNVPGPVADWLFTIKEKDYRKVIRETLQSNIIE